MTALCFALPSLRTMVPLNTALDGIDEARCFSCCSFGEMGVSLLKGFVPRELAEGGSWYGALSLCSFGMGGGVDRSPV